MNESDLLSRACETIAGYQALGNQRFEAHGATFLRNAATPRRQDVNSVVLIRGESQAEIEALLQRAETEYAGFGHRRFEVDALTPAPVGARLALEGGFKVEDVLVLVLEGALQTAPGEVEIREVSSEADWAAYRRLDELWWRESNTAYFGPYDPDLHAEMARSFRAKSPAVRSWFAWADGGARAYLSSWSGENGVGMVEDLSTEKEYRHHSLATALIAHCVAEARKGGAGPVLISADVNDTPKRMYAALGFRPLFVNRAYRRLIEQPP